MNREGNVSVIVIAIVVTSWMVILLEGAVYAGMVTNGIQTTSGELFTGSMIDEAVLNAPCATKERGVFYRSAIVSGDLRCIEPPVSVRMIVVLESGERYQRDIVRFDDGVKVINGRYSTQIGETRRYSVLVYDRESDSYTNATLRVGARGVFS